MRSKRRSDENLDNDRYDEPFQARKCADGVRQVKWQREEIVRRAASPITTTRFGPLGSRNNANTARENETAVIVEYDDNGMVFDFD